MPSNESNQLLLAAAAAAEDKKAEDIRILALDPSESGLTDYFLICNGTNDRQNLAISDEIELRLKREFGTYPNSVEGRRQAEWILMDYVDFIVHIFSPEKRAFYGLERLRKSATSLSVDELNAELKAKVAAARTSKPKKKAAAKKAPPKKAAKKAVKTTGKIVRKSAATKTTKAKAGTSAAPRKKTGKGGR
jgi:ribosome-associated protein